MAAKLLFVVLSSSFFPCVSGQQPAPITDPSCIPFNITRGPTLTASCEAHCVPHTAQSYDFAAPNTTHPNIIDRHTVCRCVNSTGGLVSECSDVEMDVWNRSVGVKADCGEYNITSGTTCQEFCSEIDPKAYRFKGSGANLQCYCASNPQFQICGSGARSMFRPSLFSLASVVMFFGFLV